MRVAGEARGWNPVVFEASNPLSAGARGVAPVWSPDLECHKARMRTRAEVGRVLGVAFGASQPPAGLIEEVISQPASEPGTVRGVQLIHLMSSVETSSGLGGVDWLVIALSRCIGLGVWLGRGQRND